MTQEQKAAAWDKLQAAYLDYTTIVDNLTIAEAMADNPEVDEAWDQFMEALYVGIARMEL